MWRTLRSRQGHSLYKDRSARSKSRPCLQAKLRTWQTLRTACSFSSVRILFSLSMLFLKIHHPCAAVQGKLQTWQVLQLIQPVSMVALIKRFGVPPLPAGRVAHVAHAAQRTRPR